MIIVCLSTKCNVNNVKKPQTYKPIVVIYIITEQPDVVIVISIICTSETIISAANMLLPMHLLKILRGNNIAAAQLYCIYEII